jgi:ketosteroid isomerase-like protein
MATSHKRTIEEANDAFAKNDIDAFLALCADDIVWTMVGDKTVTGKEAIRQWMASMPSEAPIFTVDQIIGDGDFVTAFGTMTMADQEGKPTPYDYCDVYRFRGDQIAEMRSFVMRTAPAAPVN